MTSIPTFPAFRDESGIDPVVRRPAAAAEAPAASFREQLTAATDPVPAAASVAAAPPRPAASYWTAVTYRDEGGVAPPPTEPPASQRAGADGEVTMFAEGDTPTVWDLLDLINPLQHIPVVNTLYREMTGDKIGALPRMVGGTLLGGAIGAAVTVANLVVEETTGKEVGEHVLAMFGHGTAAEPGATAVAALPQQPPAPPEANQAALPEPAPLPVIEAPPAPVAMAAPGRFMPLPPRGSLAVPASRVAAEPSEPLPMPATPAVRRAAATQGLADSGHPLLQPAVAAKPAADAKTQDFVGRFMAAMDKYDRTRGGAPQAQEN